MTQSWKKKWKEDILSYNVNFNLWLSGMRKWLIVAIVWHLGNTVYLGKRIVMEGERNVNYWEKMLS
jgi:hypothetical protein